MNPCMCEVVMSLFKFDTLNDDNCYDGGECKYFMLTCPEELDKKIMLLQLKY